MPLTLVLATERWPIRGSFAISRGAKTEAVVVVAEVSDGNARGRGECVPYARYGESIETVTTAIEKMRPELERGIDRESLQKTMPAGAARNALDCALWDFEAKRSGRPAHELAGLPPLRPLTTAFTISLAAPAEMAMYRLPAIALIHIDHGLTLLLIVSFPYHEVEGEYASALLLAVRAMAYCDRARVALQYVTHRPA